MSNRAVPNRKIRFVQEPSAGFEQAEPKGLELPLRLGRLRLDRIVRRLIRLMLL